MPLLERCFLVVHLPQDNIYPFFSSVIMLHMQQIAYRELEWVGGVRVSASQRVSWCNSHQSHNHLAISPPHTVNIALELQK